MMPGIGPPIAIVSFFFQAFAGCVQGKLAPSTSMTNCESYQGYVLIANACRLEDDAQALLVKFKIEDHRLLYWGKLVQLDYTEENLVLNQMSRGMVMDILHQQQKLLASFGRLDARCTKLKKPVLQELAQTFVVDSKYLLENGAEREDSKRSVQFPPAGDLVIKALDWIKKSSDVPKRLGWVSWDRERMEALIVKLLDFNDNMHEALDRAQMDSIPEMQSRTNYQIILLNRRMENVVRIWQSDPVAFRQPEDSEYDLFNSAHGPSSSSLTQPLGALAQQKFVHLAIQYSHKFEHLAEYTSQTMSTKATAQKPRTKAHPPISRHVVPIQRVYEINTDFKPPELQWRPSELAFSKPNELGKVDPKIEERVKKLAALLNKESRKVHICAPYCLVYFVDESKDRDSRFGLVFENPASVTSHTVPTTLREWIEAANDPTMDAIMPSLTDRITLMRVLGETVERLRAVDWLHKGLRSANILFFQKESGEEANWAEPYLSGFDYFRPATHDDMALCFTGDAAANTTATPRCNQPATARKASVARATRNRSMCTHSVSCCWR
jgi:hypothetical protein